MKYNDFIALSEGKRKILEKEDINIYLKKRILYLLSPEYNDYIEYIPYKKRVVKK